MKNIHLIRQNFMILIKSKRKDNGWVKDRDFNYRAGI